MLGSLDAQIMKIEELIDSGEDKAALSLAGELPEAYPNEPRAWWFRAHLLARNEDYDAAISDLTKAICLSPSEPLLFFDRGRYRLLLRQDQRAVADFTQGLQLCAENRNHYYKESLHFLRAEAFLRLGKKSEALSDLRHIRDGFQAWTYKLRSKSEMLREIETLADDYAN